MPEQKRDHLTKDELVLVLRRAGSRTASLEKLGADISAGAPVNADGTVNILKYIAWIAKELGDDGQH